MFKSAAFTTCAGPLMLATHGMTYTAAMATRASLVPIVTASAASLTGGESPLHAVAAAAHMATSADHAPAARTPALATSAFKESRTPLALLLSAVMAPCAGLLSDRRVMGMATCAMLVPITRAIASPTGVCCPLMAIAAVAQRAPHDVASHPAPIDVMRGPPQWPLALRGEGGMSEASVLACASLLVERAAMLAARRMPSAIIKRIPASHANRHQADTSRSPHIVRLPGTTV